MEYEFDNQGLIDLYTTGKSRKYKGLAKTVIKKFVARIGQIAAAETIHDLWRTPSLNFEKMKGKANKIGDRR